MSFFDKKREMQNSQNANQGNLRVIEHDFEDNEIAFKYPIVNFYSGSIVFVKPGQEVIFVRDENVILKPQGRYQLDTTNVPEGFSKFLGTYVDENGNKTDIFHCYIYFINKEKVLKCYWGTPEKILVDSEKYKSTLGVVANGSYTLIIDDSVELLKSTIGQLNSYNAQDIDDLLFEEVLQVITDNIAKKLQAENILFSQIQSKTREIARSVTEEIKNEKLFESYGFKLKSGIAIETLTLAEEDQEIVQKADAIYRQNRLDADLGEQKGLAEAQVIKAKGLAEAEVMNAKGAYYAQERGYDVLEAAAKNTGGGQIGGTNVMTSAIGLGVGVGLGQGFSQAMSGVASSAFNPQNNGGNVTPNVNPNQVKCSSCGQANPMGAKFCSSCGNQLVNKDMLNCPKCGQENPSSALFCSSCGQALK